MPSDLRIPLRDAVTLGCDVYGPTDAGRRPVLLIRTPYGKQGYRDDSLVSGAVERGYVVVVADVRGRYTSGGEFDAYKNEGLDGYDVIEWLAAQPWSTGRIATAGLSYPGAVQWLSAIQTPPHLACAFPAMCFSSGRQFFYFNGAFDLSWLPWTFENIAPEDRRRRKVEGGARTHEEARRSWRAHAREMLARVPVRDQPALAGVTPFYFEWLDHPDDGPYWEFANVEAHHDRVRAAVFNFSGWHDEGYGPIGAARNFVGLKARAATPEARDTRLMIGPWVHGGQGTGKVGDRDFGAAAAIDYDALVLDWSDWHARGIDRGLGSASPVRLFVMGSNSWREFQTWPPPAAPRTFYLRTQGALTMEPPLDGEAPDTYTFDPNQPVEDAHYDAGLGPHDQRALAGRADVLMFQTPPLVEDVEVIGPIEFRLWVASSAPDTDFFCRLLDVEPHGTAWNLMSPTLEVVRAKYRNGEGEPEFLRQGRPAELTFRLGLTANRFLRGHRIAVQVTSSFFPHLDRNPNTGRPAAIESRLVPARQTVFHQRSMSSRVMVPVVA